MDILDTNQRISDGKRWKFLREKKIGSFENIPASFEGLQI